MGIKCPKCQHDNPDDTLFCGKCGTQFSLPEEAELTKTLETSEQKYADAMNEFEELDAKSSELKSCCTQFEYEYTCIK